MADIQGCLTVEPGGYSRGSLCWTADILITFCAFLGCSLIAIGLLWFVDWRSNCHPAKYPLRAIQAFLFALVMGAMFVIISLTIELVHGWLDTLYGCAAFCFTFAFVVVSSMSREIKEENAPNNSDTNNLEGAEKGSEVKEVYLPTYEEVLDNNSTK